MSSAGRLARGSGTLAVSLTLAGDVYRVFNADLVAGQLAILGVLLVLVIVYAIVGALIASSDAHNRIGWLFCAVALMTGLGEFLHGYTAYWLSGGSASDTLGEFSGAYQNVSFVSFIMVPAIFLPLLFPDGRLPARRWRPAAWCGGLGILGIVTWRLLKAGPVDGFPQLQNPYAVDGQVLDVLEPLGKLLLLLALIAAPLSLVLRFRQSSYVQRQQIKWLAWAGGVAAVVVVAGVTPIKTLVGVEVYDPVVTLSIIGLPLAAGLAILRHRLYDIDVVINRTLVYGALTATLAGINLAGVLTLQVVLSGVTADNGLAITLSTLGVAALFNPARRRIQSIVDRRFYRREYDARRTLDDFAARLRDEIELTALGVELRGVVAETMQPRHVSLWLRAPEDGR